MQNVIEKRVVLDASPARVWTALTDHEAFGAWFRVALDGPFVVGEETTGSMTYPGYEGMPFAVTVVAMEPEHRFAYTWVPGAGEPDDDLSDQPTTLVEFLLEPCGAGTVLIVRESGFERVPEDRRVAAMRDNDGGWTIQLQNIADHLQRAATA